MEKGHHGQTKPGLLRTKSILVLETLSGATDLSLMVTVLTEAPRHNLC